MGTCNNVEYFCDSGDTLSGQTCYTCTRGSLNSSRFCEYTDWVSYSYWNYEVTIYYYIAK